MVSLCQKQSSAFPAGIHLQLFYYSFHTQFSVSRSSPCPPLKQLSEMEKRFFYALIPEELEKPRTEAELEIICLCSVITEPHP